MPVAALPVTWEAGVSLIAPARAARPPLVAAAIDLQESALPAAAVGSRRQISSDGRDDRRRPVGTARRPAPEHTDRPLHGVRRAPPDQRLRRLRRSVAVVGRGPRGILGVDLGVLRLRAAHTVRARARLPGDAGSGVVPGARLNYAEHLVGRDEDADRVAVSPSPRRGREMELTFGELREQVARAGPGCSARRRPRRPRRRLHCPTSPRRSWPSSPPPASGRSGPPAPRVRGAQRHRPVRPDRAQGVADRGRLRLPRPLRQRRAEVEAIRRASPASSTSSGALRRGASADAGRGHELLRSAGTARVRAGGLRPPALRALLLGDDRAAQGDRARPRRPAGGAPQEPGPRLGPQARHACSGFPPPRR